jgi:hypothetical protein
VPFSAISRSVKLRKPIMQARARRDNPPYRA